MTDLGTAITQVIGNYDNIKPKRLNFSHFATACSEALKAIGIPYYKMYLDKDEPELLHIDMPLLKSCSIRLKETDEGIYCILSVDNKDIRKIKVQSTTADYGKALANAMIDYFKRFLVFKQ